MESDSTRNGSTWPNRKEGNGPRGYPPPHTHKHTHTRAHARTSTRRSGDAVSLAPVYGYRVDRALSAMDVKKKREKSRGGCVPEGCNPVARTNPPVVGGRRSALFRRRPRARTRTRWATCVSRPVPRPSSHPHSHAVGICGLGCPATRILPYHTTTPHIVGAGAGAGVGGWRGSA